MKKRLPKEKSTVTSAPVSSQSGAVKENWVLCRKCGANCNTLAGRHTCDPFDVAAHDKNVCIDCWLHHQSTVEELTEIPINGYCKHLTPEWWAAQGWQRGWGDAAVMGWPDLEILRRDDGDFHRFLILNGKLRRPVKISFAKDGSDLEASY